MNSAATDSPWFVFEAQVPGAQEELFGWLMINMLGANGCEVVSTDGCSTVVRAVFDRKIQSAEELHQIYGILEEYGLSAVLRSARIEYVQEQDWLAEWKKGMRPLKIGGKFLVCPPWLLAELDNSGKEELHLIVIEPGLAFGTGFHDTTQFCLEVMATLEKEPASVLDVGAGSAILSIAAAKLWPDCAVDAVELDPVACRTAAENLALNQVTGRVKLIENSIDDFDAGAGKKYDLILSNMTCEDNIALLPRYKQLLQPEGKAIMSGILKEKLSRLEEALNSANVEAETISTTEKWAGVVGTF